MRVVELGANDAAFARTVLLELRVLREAGTTELERVDYVAVDLARGALERAAAREEALGEGRRVLRPAAGAAPGQPELVALVTVPSSLSVNLGLVHADATEFVRTNARAFDLAILNELLDDLPCRVFFADGGGRRFEAVPRSRGEGGRWTVRVDAEALPAGELPGLPPGTITATSPAAVELVRGLAAALAPGGLLLVHDYGFAEAYQPLSLYAGAPPTPSALADLEYPAGWLGEFPRSFFRVFGNDAHQVVQVTNDVNFAELVEALAPSGPVFAIPHGNQARQADGGPARAEGTFLGELPDLDPQADLDSLLTYLERGQASLRDHYARAYLAGRTSMFLDLVHVRSAD